MCAKLHGISDQLKCRILLDKNLTKTKCIWGHKIFYWHSRYDSLKCDFLQILCTQWLWSQILPVVHIPLDPLWTSPASYTHNHLKTDWPIGGEIMSLTHHQLFPTPAYPMPLSPLTEATLTQQDTTAGCTTGIKCLHQDILSSLYKVGCINLWDDL